MIVVSNTTPLNYLILIESDHVLPALFGRTEGQALHPQRFRGWRTKRAALTHVQRGNSDFRHWRIGRSARESIRCRLGKPTGGGGPDAASRCAREYGDDLGLRCLLSQKKVTRNIVERISI